MADNKAKKIKLSDSENAEPRFDDKTLAELTKLQEVQDEIETINEEVGEKMLEVEQKYSAVRKPLYDKRNEIIQSIPMFWLTAFVSHPALGSLLSDEDHEIFKYLDSLKVEESKDVKSGYTIIFNFTSNPYFENTKLVKNVNLLNEGTIKVTGTTINWKEGKGLPNGDDAEKKGRKRSLIEESFFSWFSDPEQSEEDELHDEIAEIIKEDLWPNPLTYFNNEADEEDEDDDDDDEEKDGDESDDDEEDNEDGDE